MIAAFTMIDDTMDDREIIAITAFSVCGAFVIGDHLAFTANFQPQLILPLMVGKLTLWSTCSLDCPQGNIQNTNKIQTINLKL